MRTAAEWTRAGEWAKAKKKKAVSASRADRQLAKAGFDYFPAIIAGAGDHAACASSNVYRQYPRSEHAAPTAAASEISFDGARRGGSTKSGKSVRGSSPHASSSADRRTRNPAGRDHLNPV